MPTLLGGAGALPVLQRSPIPGLCTGTHTAVPSNIRASCIDTCVHAYTCVQKRVHAWALASEGLALISCDRTVTGVQPPRSLGSLGDGPLCRWGPAGDSPFALPPAHQAPRT